MQISGGTTSISFSATIRKRSAMSLIPTMCVVCFDRLLEYTFETYRFYTVLHTMRTRTYLKTMREVSRVNDLNITFMDQSVVIHNKEENIVYNNMLYRVGDELQIVNVSVFRTGEISLFI
jgi:hypothetical protein